MYQYYQTPLYIMILLKTKFLLMKDNRNKLVKFMSR